MSASGKSPASTLHDEITAANGLVNVLKQEQALLIEANIDALLTLTEEKAKLIAHMAFLANARYQALAATGFTDDESGMEAWLKSPASVQTTRISWADLLTAARTAKELNRVNGLLIGKHIARNQAALNVLQGNRQSTSLYGPNGQSTTKTGSRGLVVG